MRELKYYKELPVRQVNTITYPLLLVGADCYIDIDENKYAFISFRNAGKRPFFSLYLQIKEYNSQGILIKESKFSVPTTYGRKGLFVIPEPAKIEKETEGIEVFIQFAEFNKKNFFEDSWTRKRLEDLLPSNKKVTSTSSVQFEVQPTKDELLEAAKGEAAPEEVAAEEPKVEETPVEEVAKEAASETPVEEPAKEVAPEVEPVEEAKEEPVEEAKEEEKPAEEAEAKPAKVLPPVTETKVYDRKKNFVFPIVLGVLFALGLTYVLLDFFLSRNLYWSIIGDFFAHIAPHA